MVDVFGVVYVVKCSGMMYMFVICNVVMSVLMCECVL